MSHRTQLESLIERSFKLQKTLFYSVGVVTGLTGIAILLLSALVPPKPGEETIVLVLQGVSILFLIFAVCFPLYIRNRLKTVNTLLFEHPENIATVTAVTVTRRGIPGFAVRITTAEKKMVGFNVIGPKTQAKIVELIQELII